MTKALTDAQVVHFREQGWLAPMRAMDSGQAADCAARIAAYEAKMGESANRSLKIKGHLAMPWVVELGRNPAILDAVEDAVRRFDLRQEWQGSRLCLVAPGQRLFRPRAP